jgi:hypothetical protein
MTRPALLLALALALGAHGAEPITAEQVARVRLAEAEALARIAAAHGHRLPSRMSSAERRQVIEEQAEAARAALAGQGLDAKRYARHTARMSRAQVAEVDAVLLRLQTAQQVAPPPAPPEGPQLEYGTPVSLEPPREGPGDIEIEYGTPIPLPAEEDSTALPAGK